MPWNMNTWWREKDDLVLTLALLWTGSSWSVCAGGGWTGPAAGLGWHGLVGGGGAGGAGVQGAVEQGAGGAGGCQDNIDRINS